MKVAEHAIGSMVQFNKQHATMQEVVKGKVTGIVSTTHISEYGIDVRIEYQIEQENKCRHKIPAELVTAQV